MAQEKLKIRPECFGCTCFTGYTPEDCTCARHNNPTCYRKKKTCSDLQPLFGNSGRKAEEQPEKAAKKEPGKKPEKPKEKPTRAIAYTDGSFNKAKGIWGYGVYMLVGNEKIELTGHGADLYGGWQIQGETTAALEACRKALSLGIKSLEIRYDYEGVRSWALGWWRTNKEYTYEYAMEMQRYMEQLHISFVHVKGHSGEVGNEAADRLAKKACFADESPVKKKSDAQKKKKKPAGTQQKQPEMDEGKLNPQCAAAIRAFRKKDNPRFKDFMNLKTYGLDAYSKMTIKELTEKAENGGYLSVIREKLDTEKEEAACIRWVLRGLSVDDAIHKVKVDAEVAANCNGRW